MTKVLMAQAASAMSAITNRNAAAARIVVSVSGMADDFALSTAVRRPPAIPGQDLALSP
jgi:hypothetical protein